MISFGPFLRWALATRRGRDWAVAGVYFGGAVVELTLAAVGNGGQTHVGTIGGGIGILLMGGGAVHAGVLYRPRASETRPADSNAIAIAAAKQAEARRVEARRIVKDDPTLARDLKIGRPDLPRDYDDGGLVDVNNVDADALIEHLGWSPDEAARVIEARDRLGGFASADELDAYTDLAPDRVDAVAGLMVFRRV
jgi:DNA uptake protein ComE-like DNA-binding protein